MKTLIVVFAAASGSAHAQDWNDAGPVPLDSAPLDGPSALDTEGQALDPAQSAPTSLAPTEMPPPTVVPAPPITPAEAAPPGNAQVPSGQWVFTQQYGWVYAPYAQAYTYVSPDAGLAQTYAYRQSSGWAWMITPWVVSIGPRPYWGSYGPRSYAWYASPWFGRHRPGWYRSGPAYSHARRPSPFHAHPRGPWGRRR